MKKVLIVVLGVMVVGLLGFVFTNNGKVDNKSNKDIKVNKNINSNELFSKEYESAQVKLDNMTLEEKVGQLFLVRYDKNMALSWINDYYAGGYILFAKDFDNHTKESIKEELSSLNKNSKIPLVFAVDEEGGYVTRVSRYKAFRDEKFPSPRDVYDSLGVEGLESIEKEKGELLLSLGINLNLAPVADVSVDSNDFINIRTFNRDAKETANLIGLMVDYANEVGISSSLKHFPGYGNNVDTHTGVAIDERSYDNFLNNDYLPFEEGIKRKVPSILVSHNIIKCIDSEYPATLSKMIVTGELRNKLNFSGIIITDDLSMGAVSSYVDDNSAAVLAINAGNDLIITSDFVNMYNSVITAVKSGKIKMETIDTAVRRILAWKIFYNM
ncbi:MAG: glycoside hydrolase family 3 N-terminal domain-containing protein [Bacilli bacterium]|nr:glycoside hydrolase family 3 N-terminal domain-containing protein [bacterium]MDY2696618.1 glycoside hydrolase family 3 N-terminal domain-containing protein [Bacilli bacterium]